MPTDFEVALPRIRTHAEIVFRTVACKQQKADLVSEVIALAWKWWIRLCRTSKDPTKFVSAIATFAARAVKSGRRLCGQERAKDVLSGRKFSVQSMTWLPSEVAEGLCDNHVTPVDRQAAFRIDFPEWLRSYDKRRQTIIKAMLTGEGTKDLARRFSLSQGRISQMRAEFAMGWKLFHGEETNG